MRRLLSIICLLCLVCLATAAQAELMPREYFNGTLPETFDAYQNWPWDLRDYDFGPFSIAGSFDTDAFQIPFVAPVALPAIGADNLSITLHPASEAVGFDLGTVDWAESTITFYGDDGGTEIELASFIVGEIMAPGSGPVGYQGFVGFRDDSGRDITRVTVGSFDLYLDNLYTADGPVSVDVQTWGSVKALFK